MGTRNCTIAGLACVCAAALYGCTQSAAPRAITVATSQPAPACYVGPIDVRVVDAYGRPVGDVPLGLFGGSWYSETGVEPPPYRGKARSDARGRYRSESVRECAAPTFIYAFDAPRQRAGFRIIERLAELSRLQTVQLLPARWVIGQVTCTPLEQRGERVTLASVALSPILNDRLRMRSLRYAHLPPSEARDFRFLVPPGEYALEVACDGAVPRTDIKLHVPPGDAPFDLGTYDLELSPLVQVVGGPAPPLDVVEWSDGVARTLDTAHGRPLVLVFWACNIDLQSTLRAVFRLHERLRGTDAELWLIHAPQEGGLAVVRHRELQSKPPGGEIDLEYDLLRWPFPTALDRLPEHASAGAERVGVSAAPYGRFGNPLCVVIGRDGRVGATDQWKNAEFDAAVSHALR